MKQKFIKIRLVGAENVTIVEKVGISLQAIPAFIELCEPNESYLEIEVIEKEISNSNNI